MKKRFIPWSPLKWISYENQRQVPFAAAQMNAVREADDMIRRMMQS